MNKKQNNNESLEQLKKDLIEVANKIPKSENDLFLDFMQNVWSKLFVVIKNKKPVDFMYVINYIDNRMKNTKNKQHQAFWAKILKIFIDFRNKLETL